MEREVTVVAPATVANWNVGFDGLGGALAAPSERLIVRQTPHRGEVRVRAIHGAAGLPLEADRNVAAVAAASLLRALGAPCGLELELF
jgi:homoserine kinase